MKSEIFHWGENSLSSSVRKYLHNISWHAIQQLSKYFSLLWQKHKHSFTADNVKGNLPFPLTSLCVSDLHTKHRCSYTLLKTTHFILQPLHLSQAAHTPRPYSRLPSTFFPVATASSTFTVPSQPVCSAPAASGQIGASTVAEVTVEVRWCASAQEGVGWFTGSRPGVMPAEHNSPRVSTPKSLHSPPGYTRWSDVIRKSDERRKSNTLKNDLRESDSQNVFDWSGNNWYNSISVINTVTDVMMVGPDNPVMLVVTLNSNKKDKGTLGFFLLETFLHIWREEGMAFPSSKSLALILMI